MQKDSSRSSESGGITPVDFFCECPWPGPFRRRVINPTLCWALGGLEGLSRPLFQPRRRSRQHHGNLGPSESSGRKDWGATNK